MNNQEVYYLTRNIRRIQDSIFSFVFKRFYKFCTDKKLIETYLTTRCNNDQIIKSGDMKGYRLEVVRYNNREIPYLFRFSKPFGGDFIPSCVAVPVIVKDKLSMLAVLDENEDDIYNFSIVDSIPINTKIKKILESAVSDLETLEQKRLESNHDLLISRFNNGDFLGIDVERFDSLAHIGINRETRVRQTMTAFEELKINRLDMLFSKQYSNLLDESSIALLNLFKKRDSKVIYKSTNESQILTFLIQDEYVWIVMSSSEGGLVLIPIHSIKDDTVLASALCLIGIIKEKGFKLKIKKVKPNNTSNIDVDLKNIIESCSSFDKI